MQLVFGGQIYPVQWHTAQACLLNGVLECTAAGEWKVDGFANRFLAVINEERVTVEYPDQSEAGVKFGEECFRGHDRDAVSDRDADFGAYDHRNVEARSKVVQQRAKRLVVGYVAVARTHPIRIAGEMP